MRHSLGRRLIQLAAHPSDAWVAIAAEPGHPAAVLLPGPALLAALGPVAFLVGHGMLGDPGVTFGRALAFSLVYYAFVLGLLVGKAFLLRRLGTLLACRAGDEDALKLAVWSAVPFQLAGLALAVPSVGWESVAVVAALAGGVADAWLLAKGLEVVVRGDSRSRSLLAAAAAGGHLTAWILGLFLLIKILL